MPKNKKSSFDGLGGSSFGNDVDEGLGTKNSNNSAFNNLGGNSFGEDMDIGLGKQAQAPNLDSVKLPKGGFGGNNFQEDIEQGLGKKGPASEEPQVSNQGFGGFGFEGFGEDTGAVKTPEQKKKPGRKNILDEWNDAAGGGW